MGIAAPLSSYRSAAATSKPSRATQATHRPGWSQTSTPTRTPRTAAAWLKRWIRISFGVASSSPRLTPKRQTMKQHRLCVCFTRIPLWRNLSLPPLGERQKAKNWPVGNSNRPAFSEKFYCTIFAVKQKKSSEIFRFQNLFWNCYPDLNWRPHPYQW